MYVITKNINVLENVTLKIRNGTKVFQKNVVNGEDPLDRNYGSISFLTGSKLCSRDWSVSAVDEVNGQFIISETSFNGGLYFFGSRVTTPQDISSLVEKTEEQYHECIQKCNECNTKTSYVIGNLKLNYISYLYFLDILPIDVKIGSISFNNVQTNGLRLIRSEFSLDSLEEKEIILSQKLFTTFSIVLISSVLTVKKSLTVSGYNVLVGYADTDSHLDLAKCSDLNVQVASLGANTITPENKYMPSVYQVPWIFDGKVKCATSFTLVL